MKKIYLSPLLSLGFIAVFAIGAGWLVVSTAQKASAWADDYGAIQPTPQAQAAKTHAKHAATQDPSLYTQQGQ